MLYSVNSKRIFFAFMSLFFCAFSYAQHITLPDLYDDGMTIQRGRTQTLNGITDPGMTVEIKWRGKKYKAEADSDGRFKAQILAGEAGGPFELQVGMVRIQKVFVGDVFLCSGQSNMELPMSRCEDLYRDIIDSYSNPLIHIVKTPRTFRLDEANDIFSVKKQGASLWVEPKPENNGGIGAVTFFFAKKYQEKHGVPVGIINSSVGGSPVEAWISEDSLVAFQHHYNKLLMAKDADYVKAAGEFGRRSNAAWEKLAQKYWQEFEQRPMLLNLTPDGETAGHPTTGAWQPVSPSGGWQPVSPSGGWQPVSLFSPDWARDAEGNINGLHAFRKFVNLTAEQAGSECLLRMGCIVDADEIFVNGEKVGSVSYQYPPRKYKIRKGLLRPGENIIYIRLKSYSGTPAFVTEKPYKMIFTSGSMESNLSSQSNPSNCIPEIDLSTGWEHQLVQRMPSPQGGPDFMMTPAALYKGMLAPVLDWGYSGAVWYQGESNVGRATEYETLLRLLISDWRGRIAQPLPFVIIQLANFLHPQSPDQAAQQALRDAQRRVAETTANCTWVYTGDLGEWNDIHPLQKKEVGERVQTAFERLLK